METPHTNLTPYSSSKEIIEKTFMSFGNNPKEKISEMRKADERAKSSLGSMGSKFEVAYKPKLGMPNYRNFTNTKVTKPAKQWTRSTRTIPKTDVY